MTRTDLPRRVYEKHGSWYYVTPAAKWVKLCRVKDGLPAMYRSLARLTDSEANSQRMPAVIARWIESKRPEWTPGHAADQDRIAAHMGQRFADFLPGDVSTPDCAQYLRALSDKPRTHNQHRSMLRQVLAFAAIEGLREGHNPVDNIPPAKMVQRIRIVTDAEIQAMKAAARLQSRNGEALVQMIDLAIISGQRIGDLIRIRWQDITDQGIVIVQGKGQGRVRLLIEWTPALRAAVEACKPKDADPIGHVLRTQSGRGYRYAGIRSAWDRAAERAGIEDLHIHDLRGRAGVDALEGAGQDIKAAQRLLGHTSEAMTRTYVEGKFAKRVKPAR